MSSLSTLDIRLHHRFPAQVTASGWGDGAQSAARACIESVLDSARTGVTAAQARRYLYVSAIIAVGVIVAWAAATIPSVAHAPLRLLLTFTSLVAAGVGVRSLINSGRFRRWVQLREGVRIDTITRAERRSSSRGRFWSIATGAAATLVAGAVIWLLGFLRFHG